MGNFKEDIALCKAIVLDVDGVLTDGGIMPTVDGDFIRKYNAKDGYAIAYAIKEGYKVCVISGGHGQTLMNRLTRLGIEYIYINCMDKIAAINDFCSKTSLKAEELIYMGDDIPDLDCMKFVGMPVAPADAAMEIIEVARYVSEFKGGGGCVRDVMEQWLRSQNAWAKNTHGVMASSVPSK